MKKLQHLLAWVLLWAHIFYPYSLQAQSTREIDSMLLHTHYLNHEVGDVQAALKVAFAALEMSETISYDKGQGTALYTVAVILSDVGDYEKSGLYIQKAKELRTYLQNNRSAEINLLILEARNHFGLGLYSLATKLFRQAESIVLKKMQGPAQLRSKVLLYKNAEYAFEDLDVMYCYYLKAKRIVDMPNIYEPDVPPRERLAQKAEIYGKLGNYHIEQENYDSARYYTDALRAVADSVKSPVVQGIALATQGTLARLQNDYESAIDYYSKAEQYFINGAILPNLALVYKQMSELYKELNRPKEEAAYLKRYSTLNDSIVNAQKIGLDKTVSSIVASLEREQEATRRQVRFLIVAGILIALVIIVISFRRFRKVRQKEQLLDEKASEIEQERMKLSEKEEALVKSMEEIQRKEREINELRQRILEAERERQRLSARLNDSFNEILALAKNNDSQFMTRFQEVYPDFVPKLLGINPSLKPFEISFCAYLYLGFNSNEIADYTFKSKKTIENYRYNIRKQLNLEQHQDLNMFIHNIMSKK